MIAQLYLLAYGIALLLGIAIACFQWMYLKDLAKVERKIGTRAPPFLARLLKINITLTTFIILLSLLLVVYNLARR